MKSVMKSDAGCFSTVSQSSSGQQGHSFILSLAHSLVNALEALLSSQWGLKEMQLQGHGSMWSHDTTWNLSAQEAPLH